MAARRKSKRSKQRGPQHARGDVSANPPAARTLETTAADAMTVFWLLSALAAISSQAIGLVLHLVLRWQPQTAQWLLLPARTLLVVAFVSGLVALILTPVTLHVRKTPPPRPILIAVLIAAAMAIFLRL